SLVRFICEVVPASLFITDIDGYPDLFGASRGRLIIDGDALFIPHRIAGNLLSSGVNGKQGQMSAETGCAAAYGTWAQIRFTGLPLMLLVTGNIILPLQS